MNSNSSAESFPNKQVRPRQAKQTANTKKGVLEGLNEIDDGNNQVLDINSMMNAFEDYIEKALGGSIGMPVNYYLKPLSKSYIAKLWVDKYFPNKFLKVVEPEKTE